MRVAATKLATAAACVSLPRSSGLHRLPRAPCLARLTVICQARQASRQRTCGSGSSKTSSSNRSSSGNEDALLAGDEFHATFQQQWGDRWPQLFAALVAPTRHVALNNSTFLLRQLAPADLAGAAPLADHRPQLAAALEAACNSASGSYGAADSSGSSSGSGSSGSGSQRAQAAPAPVSVLHWEPPPTQGGTVSYPPPPADPATGLTTHYWLDAASLLPPLLLDVRPGQAVLDMCAAPGGKSLVLAQLLFGAEHRQAADADAKAALAGAPAAGADAAVASASAAGSAGSGSSGGEAGAGGWDQGEAEGHLPVSALAEDDDANDVSSGGGGSHSSGSRGSRRQRLEAAGDSSGWLSGSLVCNEIDGGRRTRLVRVLKSYIPAPVCSCIRVTPHDAARWWGRQDGESFDRVLLDAPCSSDRHVVQQAAARGSAAIPRSDWSLQRCRRIAGEQAKLLAAGVKALRPGGRLVYSTCSIAELENDGVVDRLLERAQGSVEVASHTLALPPDSSAGRSSISNSSGSSSSTGSASSLAGAADFVAALEAAGAERTRHGWLLLPDAAGCGPIYLAVLHKLASSELRRVKVNKYRPA